MKTVRVVAAVIKNRDQIYATQRGYGDYKDGWEFPGGKIEPGETPEQAIVREIREELDTEIELYPLSEAGAAMASGSTGTSDPPLLPAAPSGALLGTIEYDYPAFHLSMDCFLCRIKSGHLTLKEHEAARWLTKDTLDSVDWLPADRELIEKLKKIL